MSLLVEDWVSAASGKAAARVDGQGARNGSVVCCLCSAQAPIPRLRAAAKQRRGRAGRVRPGICYGLYSRSRFEHRMRRYQVGG